MNLFVFILFVAGIIIAAPAFALSFVPIDSDLERSKHLTIELLIAVASACMLGGIVIGFVL